MLFRSHPSLELTKKFAVTPELVRALLTTIFVDANKQVHLVYRYIDRLGALTLEQRVKRWLATCGFDRGTRAGKLEQPNARRKR